MFNQVRETVDHGTLNAWERGPYFSDIGYVEDPTSSLTPTAAELEAGATPGFKLATQKGGSAVGQYTRIANNFLLGTYNVNSNLETDDGSSRYLLYLLQPITMSCHVVSILLLHMYPWFWFHC